MQVRLELTQVSDAAKFNGGVLDAAHQHSGRRAGRLQALLMQSWQVRIGMAELACMLCALNSGVFDDCEASQAQVGLLWPADLSSGSYSNTLKQSLVSY
jgi:hypothetical protein